MEIEAPRGGRGFTGTNLGLRPSRRAKTGEPWSDSPEGRRSHRLDEPACGPHRHRSAGVNLCILPVSCAGRSSPLGFAQSGSSAGRGGVSNGWKIPGGGPGLGKGLRDGFGKQMEQRGQQIRGRTRDARGLRESRQWGSTLKRLKTDARRGTGGSGDVVPPAGGGERKQD